MSFVPGGGIYPSFSPASGAGITAVNGVAPIVATTSAGVVSVSTTATTSSIVDGTNISTSTMGGATTVNVVASPTFSGTVQGATLTDGTLSSSAGAITGATSISASGTISATTISGGTITDGTGASMSGGDVNANTVFSSTFDDNAGTVVSGGAITTGSIGCGNINSGGTLTLTSTPGNVINATGAGAIVQLPTTGLIKLGVSGTSAYTEIGTTSTLGKTSVGTTTYSLTNITGTLSTIGQLISTSISAVLPALSIAGYANFGSGSPLITSAGGITAVSMNLTATSGSALTVSGNGTVNLTGTGGLAISGTSAGLSIATGTLQSRGINDNFNGTNQGSAGYVLQSAGTNLGYKWVVPPTTANYTASTSFPTLSTTQQTLTWSSTPTITLAYGSVQVSGILILQNTVAITSLNNSCNIQVFGGTTGITLISPSQFVSLPINASTGQYFCVPFSGYSSVAGVQQIVVKIQGNSATSVATVVNTTQMKISYNS